MRYIAPTVITDAMLVSSNVPEADQPAWSAASAYAAGQRVMYAHAVYERLVAGTSAATPAADAVNWGRVGPTNRWAMFDGAVGTATMADEITVVLRPGAIDALALLDMDVDSVTVSLSVDGTEVYRREIPPLATAEDVTDWFGYFFSAFQRRSVLILRDIPPYSEGVLTIAAVGVGDISIGSCVVGSVVDLGETLADASIGITDYSKKDVDDYGVITVVQRSYAKRMSVSVLMPTPAVDVAVQRLARVRAQPVVWIASDTHNALVVYGFYTSWSIVIPGRIKSTCALEVEGLI